LIHGGGNYLEGAFKSPVCYFDHTGCADEKQQIDNGIQEAGPAGITLGTLALPGAEGSSFADNLLGRLLARFGGSTATETASSAGWRVGDDVYAATRAGNRPSWSTVRARFWKNEAADPKISGQWSEANIERMRGGLAPQRYNPDLGGMESMELSHEPIPFRNGGTEFVPRWPQDHAAVDPFRFPGY
jgi:hypothetical protein